LGLPVLARRPLGKAFQELWVDGFSNLVLVVCQMRRDMLGKDSPFVSEQQIV
jgi:hypothetical protein